MTEDQKTSQELLDLINQAIDESQLPTEYISETKAKFSRMHDSGTLLEFVNKFILASPDEIKKAEMDAAKEKLDMYYKLLDVMRKGLQEKANLTEADAFAKIQRIDAEVMDGKVNVSDVLEWAAKL
jgi:hypothetical protein